MSLQNLLKNGKTYIDRVRYETFGGIISCHNPPFLAWVDRDFMRNLGYPHSHLWEKKNADPHFLSAPTEVHASVTNQCSQQCDSCYMGSSNSYTNELSTQEWKHHFKTLRELGVFHVALGGGEAFAHEDFSELVSYCKSIGLVPNLTTNGQVMGEKELEICKNMGQVNLSLDGVNNRYGINGRKGSFARVDKAITLMKRRGIEVGINCVVSRKNYSYLDEVVAYARKKKLGEVEFLKYKPTGRGKLVYEDFALSQKMIKEFYPLLQNYVKKYKMSLKIDCSFIPALVYHHPPKEDLEKLAVIGCDGGNLLMAVHSNGHFAGCSFVENCEPVVEIATRWSSSEHLNNFRTLTKRAKEPCRSCEYLSLCRCGCRAVALFKDDDFFAPDPECPFVYEYTRFH